MTWAPQLCYSNHWSTITQYCPSDEHRKKTVTSMVNMVSPPLILKYRKKRMLRTRPEYQKVNSIRLIKFTNKWYFQCSKNSERSRLSPLLYGAQSGIPGKTNFFVMLYSYTE